MESDIKIRCESHGDSSEAFACQHLYRTPGEGGSTYMVILNATRAR